MSEISSVLVLGVLAAILVIGLIVAWKVTKLLLKLALYLLVALSIAAAAWFFLAGPRG